LHTNIDRMRIIRIEEIIEETPTVRTLAFRDEISSRAGAGQFLMVWMPGAEELPMSVMIWHEKSSAALTVRKKGYGSTSLYNKSRGERLGVRGPYGNTFEIEEKTKKVMLVGGGTGLVPLLRLTGHLNDIKIDTTMIIGAKTHTEVFFEKLAGRCLADTNHKIVTTTEDGSYGIKGKATDAMLDLISNESFDTIYTCGPEAMMKKVFDLASADSIPVQASLERYMKCGIGICASCCIGDRLVCKDGTVFNSKHLSSLSEFGLKYRDKSGRKCNLSGHD
jgi:dihydroorotate dehydrogenase electron transfer subunit